MSSVEHSLSGPADRALANAIRALSMDAVEQANSGHPGAPMGMADIAEVLWRRYLSHNPLNPQWPNRDRFVLSNGHASMLLYSLLHLSGYDLSIEDLKQFRQLHSKTPGHPEVGHTPGVETTTGPLGQGLANAVGMAIAEKTLAAQFNRPGFDLMDHHTYVFVGDGCLMEGISHEVCSLAGTLGLGKLIVFYDDNGISIDGHVQGWFTDNTAQRFMAYGWQVIPRVDGHNAEEIIAAIEMARHNTDHPTLICCQTIIGCGAPTQQGTHDVHGKALGKTEIQAARDYLGWAYPPFEIPSTIYDAWDAKKIGAEKELVWEANFNRYQAMYPELAAELKRRLTGELPKAWSELSQSFIHEQQKANLKVATRKASELCLEAYAPLLPELLGGSADLATSNNTLWSGSRGIQQQADGNYIFYGVREFGMTAIMSGLTLHGGFIPYGGTFLVFMDYARNAVRMAALMQKRVVLVYTHDSIGLGEDGPTHQPIEHLASLRAMPNMRVWRPCDAVETAVAWQQAIERVDGPTALILTRQALAPIARSEKSVAQIQRGAYMVEGSSENPDSILIATGSEVALAQRAMEKLQQQGKRVRLISMPCAESFLQQDKHYQAQLLPANITCRVAIEAASVGYWSQFVGLQGRVIGMQSFGASAPADQLFKEFHITVDAIIAAVNSCLN